MKSIIIFLSLLEGYGKLEKMSGKSQGILRLTMRGYPDLEKLSGKNQEILILTFSGSPDLFWVYHKTNLIS